MALPMPQFHIATASRDSFGGLPRSAVGQLLALSKSATASFERLSSGDQLVSLDHDSLSFAEAARLRSHAGAHSIVFDSAQLSFASIGIATSPKPDSIQTRFTRVDRSKRTLSGSTCATETQSALPQHQSDLSFSLFEHSARSIRSASDLQTTNDSSKSDPLRHTPICVSTRRAENAAALLARDSRSFTALFNHRLSLSATSRVAASQRSASGIDRIEAAAARVLTYLIQTRLGIQMLAAFCFRHRVLRPASCAY